MWQKSCILLWQECWYVLICDGEFWTWWICEKDNFSVSLELFFSLPVIQSASFYWRLYSPWPPTTSFEWDFMPICILLTDILFTSTFIHFSELTSSDKQTCNDLTSCKNQCPKNLAACGHRCPSLCHAGPCPSPKTCSKKTAVRCPCRRKKKVSLFLI